MPTKPEGVVLILDDGHEVPVDVEFVGCEDDRPIALWQVVMPPNVDVRGYRITSLRIARFPGRSSIVIPADIGGGEPG